MSFLRRILFWWLKPFDITRDETGSEVYVRRYHVAKNRFFQIYVHNIRLQDDDPDPHDHPWSFLSLILWGGYTDESWLPSFWTETHFKGPLCWTQHRGAMDKRREDVVRVGSVRFRKAEHIHRVRDVQPHTWTIVFGGPVRRVWGFWKKDTAQWSGWRKYLGIPDDQEYKGD